MILRDHLIWDCDWHEWVGGSPPRPASLNSSPPCSTLLSQLLHGGAFSRGLASFNSHGAANSKEESRRKTAAAAAAAAATGRGAARRAAVGSNDEGGGVPEGRGGSGMEGINDLAHSVLNSIRSHRFAVVLANLLGTA
eukprot:759333-Pelagomonas_calceolata.AAC.2